jgi:hypothetical protein
MFNMVENPIQKRSKKAFILRGPFFDFETPQKSKVSRNYARF